MFPYWILFTGFAAAAIFSEPRFERRQVGAMMVAAGVAVSLMIGLRHMVGGDWGAYELAFEYVRRSSFWGSFQLGFDPAYTLLNWFAARIGAGLWLVNLICGALLIWGIGTIANRQPNPWLVFVIAIPYLIIVVGMGYTRQAAAIGLVLVGFSAFLDRKWIWFFATMIIATLFHKTAIIMVPIAGLAISSNRLITTALVSALGLLLFEALLQPQLENLNRNYIGAEYQSEGAFVRVMMNVVPAVLFLGAQRWFGFSEDERKLWRNVALGVLASAIGLFVVGSSTVVDRLALYFIVIQLVILGRLPWAFGPPGALRQLMFAGVILYSAAIQFVWLNYATHAEVWIPYETVLSAS